ncbi:tol-pal system protein YbgF [Anatilimnocola aggregata]|uniref:Tol-pal system protein YbgF n=1 Tax=Anatilimnocola aggregata TaxID=2528021 RepID=A0A517YM42_9BACT|nr:tetratricopeptide repeat protein [Anatilimnocola aggregata]QDU31290.1 tol-pal system protein YbgF [Anatilimnocola aggregata]
MPRPVVAWLFIVCLSGSLIAVAQENPAAAPAEGDAAVRGSIVEDRLAKKLIEAGDARVDADEGSKAIEIWKSVIERYPRSKFRFDAHLRLGNYFLDKERAYERARPHFEAAGTEDNRSEEQRAEATLKLGVCYYHNRNYGKSFQIMRDVIERFPVSPQVNEAYYYIGLGHFQLGHYSRAIQALEKVGTTLSGEAGQSSKLEAGKRFFLKIEDADLAVLEPNQTIKVRAKTTSGDEEDIECFPVGRNVRLVLGSIPSRLGKPRKQNGMLDVRGGDKVQVTYTDEHTADKKLKVPIDREVLIVGTANVAVTDGAFAETVNGVVLGKTVNVRINDGDRDASDGADTIKAVVEVYRQKSEQEVEAEIAALKGKPAVPAAGDEESTELEIERFKLVDKLELTLTEAKPNISAASREAPTRSGEQPVDPAKPATTPAPGEASEGAAPAETAAPVTTTASTEEPIDDGSLHSGLFQATVVLVKSEEVVADDQILQALPGDQVRVTYLDEVHFKDGVRDVQARVACLEGNIGGVRVTKAEITDQQLRVQTQLKTADALTQIGNRYKEFGLKDKAVEKYDQALDVCDEIADEARKIGGSLLEQTYVQLWNIYFAMDKLDLAAAMCSRLQNEFPASGFVDDAMLQLGDVARKGGDLQRAIGIYSRLAGMKTSQLRGEAQFGIAECYETMANKAPNPASASQMQDRAFQEFKKVYDQYPESGRVGEAVAKMANYYYTQKDYARAVDTFETVLNNHPDAKFLDVILFNYGRCLYRMERKGDARRRFDQLISEFPESPLATDAKKISEALAKAGF